MALRRHEVAARLDMSVGGVRHLERRGELPSQVQPDGVHVYDEDVVEALARARQSPRAMSTVAAPPQPDGEAAAAAFAMYDDGKGVRQVVRSLKMRPLLARELHAEWLTAGRDLIVPARLRDRIETFLRRPLKGPDDFVGILETVVTWHEDRTRFVFPCAICGRAIEIDADGWENVLRAGACRGWHHIECAAGMPGGSNA
jgi:hypothetical protein